MKFTQKWLEGVLGTSLPKRQEFEALLSRLGFPVESFTDFRDQLRAFCVGHIVKAAPHPNADRLQVCEVETSHGAFSVVCGAPNARAGLKTIFAPLGTFIPGLQIKLKKTKIRGLESQGMLCSFEELELTQSRFQKQESGIAELSEEASLSDSLAALLGCDDVVFDVEITANRGDLMSIRGLARDVAAALALDAPYLLAPLESPTLEASAANLLELEREAAPFVHNVGFVKIENLKTCQTDLASLMAKRLEAIGLAPELLPVDFTNDLMLETGQPSHAFDADKIQGSLVLRLSQEGEIFEALNSKTYTLRSGCLVFADEGGIVSLAGVMGGARTAVSPETQNLLLEVASFDPQMVSQSARSLGLVTDAALRFERGVDPMLRRPVLNLLAKNVETHCGGTIVAQQTVEGTRTFERPSIAWSPQQFHSLTGLTIAKEEAVSLLKRLGCSVKPKDLEMLFVTPPSWRFDFEAAPCVTEEILRLYGYDHLEEAPLPTKVPKISDDEPLDKARQLLASRGLCEIMTWSFIDAVRAKVFTEDLVALENPLSQEMAVMRPSLLPGLLKTLAQNRAQGLGSGRGLFETGRIYEGLTPDDQPFQTAGVFEVVKPSHWASLPETTAYDAKTHILALWEGLGNAATKLEETSAQKLPCYHPGQSGELRYKKKLIARFGTLHPTFLKGYNLPSSVCAFEVIWPNWPSVRHVLQSADKPPVHPPLRKDLAFIMDSKVAAGDITRCLRQGLAQTLLEVNIFDVFEDGSLGDHKKSLALTLVLNPPEASVQDTWIHEQMDKATHILAEKFGAVLRDGVKAA